MIKTDSENTSELPEIEKPEIEKHYTYDVRKLNDSGVDQMRFELGDTIVEGADKTCVLCDEEYKAIIDKSFSEKKSWKRARFLCLKAIVMKLSYEVDYKADSISFSLSQRYDNWKRMYDEEKKLNGYGSISSALGRNSLKEEHYFTLGMLNNHKAL